MSAAEQLLIERHEHVVTLTLNRPGAKNAFGLEMLARLADAWEMVDADDDVRAVVLTGAGGDFCAGADLKLMHGDQSDNPWHKRFQEDSDLHWRALLRHYSPKKPVIAACEGIALGGGTEILQGTDIRVAAEGALFGE
jgi:enoyl-CoA hydratase